MSKRKWTDEALINQVKKYKTMKELRKKDYCVLMLVYKRGLIGEAKKYITHQERKYTVYGVNVVGLLNELFKHKNSSTVSNTVKDIANRNNIDLVEFFENKDDAGYLQSLFACLSKELHPISKVG